MSHLTLAEHAAPLPRHFDKREDDVTPVELFDAEAEVLADIESFTNWLCGECAHQPPVRLGLVPLRDDVELAALVERASLSELVALQHYPNPGVCFKATQELTRRYLAARLPEVLQVVAEARAAA